MTPKSADKRLKNSKKKNSPAALLGEVAHTIWDEKTNVYFIALGKKITKSDLARINFKKLDLDAQLVGRPGKK